MGDRFPSSRPADIWHPHHPVPKDQTQVRPHQQALILRHITGKISINHAGWVNFYDYPRSYFHPKHVSSSMHFNFNVFTSSYWKKTLAVQDVSGWPKNAMAMACNGHLLPSTLAPRHFCQSPKPSRLPLHTAHLQHGSAPSGCYLCLWAPKHPPEGGVSHGFTLWIVRNTAYQSTVHCARTIPNTHC